MWRTLLVLLLTALVAAGCSKRVDEPTTSDFKPKEATPLPPPPDKLEITDEVVGTGREAQSGDHIKANYIGTLMNGKKFDSSYDSGKPLETQLGTGGVIKGWDQGIPGMKVGGKRKLVIPPELGYGPEGSEPNIPPNAGLIFEVELLSVE
jgi:peptidylprolyl isomerase